jgi:ABC-2 type transport system permease protein
MSSATTRTALPRLEQRGRLTQLHVTRSEWTKLISVRSTRWSLLAAVVLTIGLPLLVAAIVSSHWGTMTAEERAQNDPLDIALAGVSLAQLAIAVLGVLLITGEYSTGMIRASFTAVPRRLPVLWGKLGIYAAVAFVLSLPSVLIAFFASQAILSRHDVLQVSFSSSGVARSVVAGAVYLALVGVFAVALGAIVRNTAAGISIFAALFFVIPPLTLLLPSSWHDAIIPYLPSEAGAAIFALTHGPNTLSPAAGLAVFVGYSALMTLVAAVLLVRRDT